MKISKANINRYYKIQKGFIVQKLENKTVIFDENQSILYTFNDTASFLFELIKKSSNETQLLSALVRRFGIDEITARKDINTLLTDLLKKKIITQKTE